MINEGKRKQDQEKAFDVNYYFADNEEPGRGSLARLIRAGKDAAYFKRVYAEYMNEFVTDGGLVLLNYDNHDYANDTGKIRYEENPGYPAVEMILFYMYTMRGVPFLYNGCEVADKSEQSIWANRFHGANMTIEWENALTEKGKRRLEKIKEFNEIRKSIPALTCRGNVSFFTCENDNVLLYERELAGDKYLVCLNLSEDNQAVFVGSVKSIVHCCGVEYSNGNAEMSAYGYALFAI